MALQDVKGTLSHGFTLAFLDEELLDEVCAAQTVDGLEFFQDLPALAAEFRKSGSGVAPGNACISTDTLSGSDFALD